MCVCSYSFRVAISVLLIVLHEDLHCFYNKCKHLILQALLHKKYFSQVEIALVVRGDSTQYFWFILSSMVFPRVISDQQHQDSVFFSSVAPGVELLPYECWVQKGNPRPLPRIDFLQHCTGENENTSDLLLCLWHIILRD